MTSLRHMRPFTQAPILTVQMTKGHAGITPHGLCETVP
jgi:hypothetical protein